MLVFLEHTVDDLCRKWDAELVEFNGEADHVHMLLKLNPKTSPSVAANNLKTVTSRLLRKQFGPALAKTYWKPVLWSRTYFVTSCGGAPLEVIKAYIQGQARPD
jgi:putative transposase